MYLEEVLYSMFLETTKTDTWRVKDTTWRLIKVEVGFRVRQGTVPKGFRGSQVSENKHNFNPKADTVSLWTSNENEWILIKVVI